MSLGAIDFGLIVDGAVIIVENAVRRLAEARAARERELTPTSGSRSSKTPPSRSAAPAFSAKLIIAIVYLPILALRGIEGKLFRPMARTVLFALLGAFILSLTLVPVLTSSSSSGKRAGHDTWLMRKAHARLRPAASPRAGAAVGHARRRAGGARAGRGPLTRLGAEFVPQLDEGDLLLEVRRLPGIALSESIATDQRIARASGRSGKSTTSCRAPGRRRLRPTRWGSSRATSTSP